MRKKIAVYLGLLALVMTGAVALYCAGTDVSLRLGMTGEEVDSILNQPNWHDYKDIERHRQGIREQGLWYGREPDYLGERGYVVVFFDEEGRVTGWRRTKLDRQRLSWWQKALYVTRLDSKPTPPPFHGTPPALRP